MDYKIGIIGLGFVGSAIYSSFKKLSINVYGFDKYKKDDNTNTVGIGTFEEVILCNIIFLCLPTPYDSKLQEYDKSAIYSTCEEMYNLGYTGIIIIKSTIEIGTISLLESKYPLNYIHNPEFLTARTAEEDFHNQSHIVIGCGSIIKEEQINQIIDFYSNYYKNALISRCLASESESMKLFCNCFYSVKIQFFNELYLLCKKLNIDYDTVKNLMLANNWINPMHTNVPGPDGQLSYGGLCFPKDTNALNELMKKLETPNAVMDAVINERNIMRPDSDNCK
jgi:UDPglucose 6-dehydrogenase